MILIDNINILKQIYPATWEKIKETEKNIDTELLQFEDTKQGNKTIYMKKDGKRSYIHSKYNPIREAETIIEEYKDVGKDTTVIFYGTGLGYHIDLFLERHPHVNYYIYEPIPEVLYNYLSYKSLKRLSSYKLKDIVLGNDETTIRTFINQFIDKSSKDILHVCLNSHINLFPEEYKSFLELFKETIGDKKKELGAELKFQKRWITNSMKNFGDVLTTPNILLEKRGEFKGKPALIVAAGPSLNEEIENIRYIKEKGFAYIFSVGSAIRTLLHYNIHPHVVCTYDPKPGNHWIYKGIKDKRISEIAMIYGSSVGYETIIDYPGERYHMITSQDTVAGYYLKNKDNSEINIVYDAPSIAVVTIQLLYELGFSPIILVGQNLGYKGEKAYSDGLKYKENITEEQREKAISVVDVYGEKILTSEVFNAMRQQIEHYIRVLPNINVINTTKGGVHIEGTEFIELKKIMDENLKQPIVEANWLEGSKTAYDLDYLIVQKDKMDKSYYKALKINKDYNTILDKIVKSINNRNFSQAENLYIKLDKELRKIENNDFYKTFILPMNRVEYKLLADSIDRLNDIKDPYEKGNIIVEKFRNFMKLCTKNIEEIEPIYKELKKRIEKYMGGS